MQGYSAKQIAPPKRQKVFDGPVVPVLGPGVDVNSLPSVAHKTICDVERDCRRYCGVIHRDEGLPADAPADFVDYFGDIFAQQAL